jgi:hypothetical protein
MYLSRIALTDKLAEEYMIGTCTARKLCVKGDDIVINGRNL